MQHPLSLLLAALLLAAAAASPGEAAGQGAPVDSTRVCAEPIVVYYETLSGPYAEFIRAAELTGASPLRPHLIRRPATERPGPVCNHPSPLAHEWERRTRPIVPPDPAGPGRWWRWVISPPSVELLAPYLSVGYNSSYPDSRNDGARWAGRGVSALATTGVSFRWGPISAAVAPQWLHQENRDFETPGPLPPGRPVYGGRWIRGLIDLPARPGEEPLRSRELVQSHLRIDALGFGLGISNENLWWGPASRYPLLMSNTAPGFPHLFVGTSRPLSTPIGAFEAQLIWGRLEQSGHFDVSTTSDRVLLAGIVVDYEPRWLPGLYLGAARSYLRELPEEGLELESWALGPYQGMRDNDGDHPDNQLVSLFARWAFPEVGFEVYAEWGREDHWGEFQDLILEPDHSQAYTIGFQQLAPVAGRWLRLHGEVIRLQQALPQYNTRITTPSFYRHTKVRQGYTHRGQLLGAGIGPGSNAQFLGLDLFTARGLVGIFGERIVHDADTHFQILSAHYGAAAQDIELILGLRQLLFLGPLDISWSASLAHRRNRDFIGLSPGTPAPEPHYTLVERNWHLELGVGWHP